MEKIRLTLNSFFDPVFSWFYTNSSKIIFSIVALSISILVYRILTRQINRWKEQKKLEENIAFTLRRVLQWVLILAIVMIAISMFVIDIGIIGGLLSLAGGTIIGFAAMNTLGNAIAGIIVDRIYQVHPAAGCSSVCRAAILSFSTEFATAFSSSSLCMASSGLPR